MNKYLQRALHEHNMSIPAYAPFYRFEQLSAADRSRVEERALELEYESFEEEVREAVGRGLENL